MIRRAALALALVLCAFAAHGEDAYHRENLQLPMAAAGSQGLETQFIRPAAPGKYPLVIISHGSPRKAEDRAKMWPGTYYPNALEFARRGWAVAVFMRRGYGGSGGKDAERIKSCDDPDYVAAGRNSAQDIKAAIKALSQRTDVDATRILAVGQSAGGFATVALTADPPPGLVAAISFAGGRGSQSDFVVCNEDRLAGAFGVFGKTSRIPMLWVYTENDHFFAPPLAEKFRSAFASAGGTAEFIKAPAFGKDGHGLFSMNGIPAWTPYVDAYLAKRKLTLRAALMDLPAVPAVIVPPQLGRTGREAFNIYLRAAGHKAFAASNDSYYGWQSAKRTVDEAKAGALKLCEGDKNRACRIVFIDDQPTP